MTSIAIFAISSAAVTVTVAIAMFLLGRRAADAERRAGDEAVAKTLAEGKLLSVTSSSETWKAKALEEEKRNVALCDLLAEAAESLPADGARARLHQKWFVSQVPHAPAGSDAGPVPHSPEPDASDPDGLIDPFK